MACYVTLFDVSVQHHHFCSHEEICAMKDMLKLTLVFSCGLDFIIHCCYYWTSNDVLSMPLIGQDVAVLSPSVDFCKPITLHFHVEFDHLVCGKEYFFKRLVKNICFQQSPRTCGPGL